ncbi:hypothetical protein B0H14DRAFT_2702144, partial [Mycena olivaceomarginata]
ICGYGMRVRCRSTGRNGEAISKLLERGLIVCACCLVFLVVHRSFAFYFLFFHFLYFSLIYLGSFSALTHHGLQAQKEENDPERVDEARLASPHCARSSTLLSLRAPLPHTLGESLNPGICTKR